MAEPAKHSIGYGESLNLTTSLCLTYTLIVGVLRVWVRRGKYGLDDAVILAATLLAVGQFAAGYVALHFDAGTPWKLIPESNKTPLNQASLASIVTYTIALYLSKCAVVTFLARLTKQQSHILMYNICLGIIAAIGIASVLLVTVSWPDYHNSYWWFSSASGVCSPQSTRWAVFTGLDVATEVLLLVLPAQLLWGLLMPRSKKGAVLTAFWLRIPTIGITIARAVYMRNLCNSDVDAGIAAAIVLMYCSGETSYAIATSTFSTLKAFTEDFNSGFGQGFTRRAGEYGSYGLSKMNDASGNGTSSGGKAKFIVSPTATGPDSNDSLRTTHSDRHGPESQQNAAAFLRVRPDIANTSTSVSVTSPPHNNSFHSATGHRNAGMSAVNGATGPNDIVVVRETECYVQHSDHRDDVPILRDTSSGPYGF